jgi:hypothetical protein
MIYHEIKFKHPNMGMADTVSKAQEAYDLYPYNYHMSRWVAEKALYSNQNAIVASEWVSRGIALNPWQRELQWLNTVLIGQTSAVEAAQLWEAYSDWAFWNRWNLAGRVYWYALAGRVEDAEDYFAYLKGQNGDYAWAEQALKSARLRQR